LVLQGEWHAAENSCGSGSIQLSKKLYVKMKKFIPLLFAGVFFAAATFAQEFKGQWKGQFVDNSSSFLGWGGEKCDYVLELEVNGTQVSGYSYTYFNDGGKRYYTICKLEGKLNKRSKYIEVTETERTKTNVPTHIRNCFQVHKLTYFKQGDEQILEGSWIPAPKQEGDCGYGTTTLSRRVLKTNNPLFNDATTKNKSKKKPDTKLDSIFKDKNKKTAPPVVNNTKPIAPPPAVKPKPIIITEPKKQPPAVAKVEPKTQPAPAAPIAKEKTEIKPVPKTGTPPVIKNTPAIKPKQDVNFEKRNNNLIKTIEIESETFKVDLYDNGDIDGDTISLFFNGRLLLSNKRLSDKPLSLTLSAEGNQNVNELVMYAENLGSIPPNTALMIVTDGKNRYEVRLASDLEKSGVIRFVHKSKTTQ
jgi:hypothetical protein